MALWSFLQMRMPLRMFCSLFSYMHYSELDWLIIYFTTPSWYGIPLLITARMRLSNLWATLIIALLGSLCACLRNIVAMPYRYAPLLSWLLPVSFSAGDCFFWSIQDWFCCRCSDKCLALIPRWQPVHQAG